MAAATIVASVSVIGFGALAAPVSAAAAPLTSAAAERSLRSGLGDSLKLRRGQDGVVHQLATGAGRPIARSAGVKAGSSDVSARSFLTTYGALFGLRDPARQLRVQRTSALSGGLHVTRFQQLAGGLPVLGGELTVTTDSAGNVLSAGGETARTVRSPALSVTPAAAQASALRVTAKSRRLKATQLSASTPTLISYDPSLLGSPGPAGATPAWQVEVSGPAVREQVLVDVADGRVLLQLNQAMTATNRLVCDRANAELVDYSCDVAHKTRTEGQAATALPDANAAYDNIGATSAYFANTMGEDLTAMIGTVPAGATAKALRAATRVCLAGDPCPMSNAFWDGQQTTFGQGYTAEDVVAHEFTHGITEHTSNLAYLYQSGAINESMSDVFGELVDLSDGVTAPDSTDNWLIGEGIPGGAIRSMSDPTAFGQPDKMTSPNYYTAIDPSDDGGGVHANSGVGNKTAYLISHGGTFNGQTITGIGTNKMAVIFYSTLYALAPGADYADLGATLSSSCSDLIGFGSFVAADCVEVDNAVLATELAQQPTDPAAAAPEAPVCNGSLAKTSLFSDNMESTGNWSRSGTQAGWTFAAGYATSGTKAMDGFTSEDAAVGAYSGFAQGAPIYIAPGQTSYLRFRHYDAFEFTYDGGQVQYSTNSGGTWVDAGALPTDNGYNADITLGTPTTQFRGFGGQSAGFVSTRIDVSSLAGNNVQFRFRIAGDESVRSDWLIDDVSVYQCSALPTTPVRPRADYNGDNMADIAVWSPTSGTWLLPGGPVAYGRSGDVPVAGDFAGDAKSDVAVWRPSNGTWYVSGQPAVSFGASTDKPVAADYLGDGKVDVAVWRPSNGTWYIKGQPTVAFGAAGDIPVPADFTGDGRADLAVFRPSNGMWYVKGMTAVAFGKAGDQPVVADFIGAGRVGIAVWRPSNGTWYIRNVTAVAYGGSKDIPVAADFTGDGIADVAVWRPSNATWYFRNGGSPTVWGQSGDVPLH